MNAYRDDHAWIPRLVHHVRLAESLLQIFASVPQKIRMDMEDWEIADLQREARSSYEGVWENLGLARELVATAGRDVSAYDRARAAAGNIWSSADVDAGGWRGGVGPMHGLGRSRQVYVASAPIEPAIAAVTALRAAVPEVVIPPPTQEAAVDLRSFGWLRRGWPFLFAAAMIAFVLWRLLARA